MDKYLEYMVAYVSINYAKECLKKGLKKDFDESLRNVLLILKDAKLFAEKKVPLYFKFRREWIKLMKIIEKKY
jgi:hypothetical protein